MFCNLRFLAKMLKRPFPQNISAICFPLFGFTKQYLHVISFLHNNPNNFHITFICTIKCLILNTLANWQILFPKRFHNSLNLKQALSLAYVQVPSVNLWNKHNILYPFLQQIIRWIYPFGNLAEKCQTSNSETAFFVDVVLKI